MITPHPGHEIQVTGGGPFGRAWLDCTCGVDRVFASRRAANTAALTHHHEVGGCNCPPLVIELDVHPTFSGSVLPRRHRPHPPLVRSNPHTPTTTSESRIQ